MDINLFSKYLAEQLPRYIDILGQMVRINSYTRNPQGVNTLGEITAGHFSELGFESENIQSTNPEFGRHVFLKRPSTMIQTKNGSMVPAVAFVSHLDTVFSAQEELEQDFNFRVESDRIYGPGSVDCKGGTVMVYMILDALAKNAPKIFESVDWLVALDASEETFSEDFGALCLEKIQPEAIACLVMEGGTPDSRGFPLVVSRKGHASFRIKTTGRGAHAGNYHHQGANAIVQMADTILQISKLTDYSQQLTYNVGVVQGGDVANRVPHQAEARLEMRAFSPEVFQAGITRILELDGSSTITSEDGFPCKVKVEMLSSSNPWPRNPKTEALLEVWTEVGKSIDLNAVPEARGGISDGNLLWQSLPVLDGLGPTGTNAHCSERSADGSKDQEYALKSSFIPKALLNLAGIQKLIDQ